MASDSSPIDRLIKIALGQYDKIALGQYDGQFPSRARPLLQFRCPIAVVGGDNQFQTQIGSWLSPCPRDLDRGPSGAKIIGVREGKAETGPAHGARSALHGVREPR